MQVAAPIVAVLLLTSGVVATFLARLFPDIRPRWLVVVIFVSVAPVLALLMLGPTVQLRPVLGACGFTLGLVAISLVDYESRTIPDVFVIPLIFAGLGWLFVVGGPWLERLGWVVGLVAIMLLSGLLFRTRASPIGAGDVLLVAAAISWMGPGLMIDVFLLCAALLILGLAGRAVRGLAIDELPLAPAFSAACLAIWFGLRVV